ncbi:hypothetical protein [Pseudoxanthomonas mexicana]
MKLLTIRAFIFLALALAYSSLCGAAANVAKQPERISQGYSDGSSTELACSDVVCRFSVIEAGRKRSFKFARMLFGYHISVDDYGFFEETKRDPFHLSLVVSCSDEDFRFLSGVNEDTLECEMQFVPKSGALIPMNVRVSGVVGERYSSRLRSLQGEGADEDG